MPRLTTGTTSTLIASSLAGALASGAVTTAPSPASPLPGDDSAHVRVADAPDGSPPPAADSGSAYLAPSGAAEVLRPFERPTARWSPGHRGVDLATRVGGDVVAPADGVVAFAGIVVDRHVVTVTHADGRRSSLEPVTSSLAAGAQVRRGEVLGRVEDAPGHCAPATCLHWGVREGEDYIDPMSLIAGAGPVVLLPRRTGVRSAPTP
ncbi:M23 family metallopeptidase [Cellulomonas chengniuliangii]|uniref:M23 family metallopeptidase n=1 Tax=Cellulomonas chengniuliangii TaxID=2968084 RepID=A0ABY5KY83_9CELL|nr:M23 family metallopeptidase [Cellulomonas chengniuliangii]MCC2309058.1 M23 family metallopeptidase [Cellulomonas chengniuliangii]MCC2319202.1 M23 family metallopeptidase [Cellulomonas chengniuliangii]MCC2319303.1 M23 family metallopeptidase [Cellulomonas chengniuliangii]UUI74212.1 M23 family metallopeptidase [Cellulomonas chengniuliangii]